LSICVKKDEAGALLTTALDGGKNVIILFKRLFSRNIGLGGVKNRIPDPHYPAEIVTFLNYSDFYASECR
jgi:hypothetical protein